jgi:hypothetical protein
MRKYVSKWRMFPYEGEYFPPKRGNFSMNGKNMNSNGECLHMKDLQYSVYDMLNK